jgi:hypothetical protein
MLAAIPGYWNNRLPYWSTSSSRKSSIEWMQYRCDSMTARCTGCSLARDSNAYHLSEKPLRSCGAWRYQVRMDHWCCTSISSLFTALCLLVRWASETDRYWTIMVDYLTHSTNVPVLMNHVRAFVSVLDWALASKHIVTAHFRSSEATWLLGWGLTRVVRSWDFAFVYDESSRWVSDDLWEEEGSRKSDLFYIILRSRNLPPCATSISVRIPSSVFEIIRSDCFLTMLAIPFRKGSNRGLQYHEMRGGN